VVTVGELLPFAFDGDVLAESTAPKKPTKKPVKKPTKKPSRPAA
jgi:hypothetical protein